MKEKFKSGFVALIGRPNVGKSTLMNQIIGQKIAITSKKPQTTRNKIQTVYTCDAVSYTHLDVYKRQPEMYSPLFSSSCFKTSSFMLMVTETFLN